MPPSYCKELGAVLGRGGTDARVSDRAQDAKLVPLRVPSADKRRKTEPSELE